MDVKITQEMVNAVRAFVPAPCSVDQAKRAIEALLQCVSNCQACPDGCAECSRDESDCECYTHAENHPDTRGNEALSAIAEQAQRGTVTRAFVKRIAKHFGFEVS